VKYAAVLKRGADKGHQELAKAVAKAAVTLASDVKKNIVSGGELAGVPFTPNAPSTIARKGSSKPLIDSGDMMKAVAARKESPLVWFVGIAGNEQSEGVSIVEYARIHEFGLISEDGQMTIARPFFFPTVDKRRDALQQQIKETMENLFK